MKLYRNVVSLTLVVVLSTLASSTSADESFGELIFEDSFERSEKDDTKEQVGNGWITNSKSRANGHKQVDLADGAVHITMHPTADHGVSFVHDQEFTNGTVALRVKLGPKDDFGINFADMKEKSVHAGHLFQVKFRPGKMMLMDLKTGQMRLDWRNRRKAGEKLPKDVTKVINSKTRTFDTKLTPGEWHDVEVHVDGDVMIVKIDGEVAGEFASEGIAHPTKRRVRLAVGRQAWVDDVKIWKRS